MEMEITTQTEGGEAPIIFTNKGIDNPNFITMVCNEEEHLILLKELEAVVIAFNKISEV